ncbi:unnamed protein product [Ostreobium quekettii]|uniref:TFA2 Winged helix domain-containing protein n=1 Tax=Ostreobium quekettii TaxID=121088 RepID=A0A8S1ISK8_9CHLO|nr:unnamed protein product [Ostreobium quekettii]|eukprot:evm.model.scf_264.5 EVM.evm.TU.scf_264.5   scf_264:72487-73329(-)
MSGHTNLEATIFTHLAELQGKNGGPEVKKKPARSRAKKDSSKAAAQKRAAPDTAASLLSSRPKNDPPRTQAQKRVPEVPVSKRLKDVVQCLRQHGGLMSAAEITAKCQVEMDDPGLLEKLRANERVEQLQDGRYLYKPKLDHVRDKEQLINHVRGNPSGTKWGDLSDAYPEVARDLEELRQGRRVFVYRSLDKDNDVVYPNDPKLLHVVVSEEVQALFRESKFEGTEEELEGALKKAGLVRAKRRGVFERQQVERPRKAPRKRSFRKHITNTHMADTGIV